jgi:hypothetical protein
LTEAAAATTKRKVGFTTIVSSIFLVATLIWAIFTALQIYSEEVRDFQPHETYDEVEPWAYDLDDWAGGRSFWFENLDYNDLNLTDDLPEELLDAYNETLFLVEPSNPPQLWRSSAYDLYDQHSWEKSQDEQRDLNADEMLTRQNAEAQGNTIYKVTFNVTAGPNTGFLELPILFPRIQIIQDSIAADPADRLISYSLQTDEYGTLLMEPFIEGETGTNVLVSYELTFDQQDLATIAQESLNGDDVDMPTYQDLSFTPTDTVIQEASQFSDAGSAYDTAMAVDHYFETTYELKISDQDLGDRPQNQEVTDWFIERGGGLPMDFATAYCVFMRYLNIPSRMVVGYAVGEQVNGGRAIKVYHMLFWCEVFIPLPGGGEWIQVIPYPLSNLIQSTENPANVGEGDITLRVGTNLGRIWVNIGEEFELNAVLSLSGSPVATPEEIEFWDDTDNIFIGTATITQDESIPTASIAYTFPTGSSIGFHNMSAIYFSETYWIKNYTVLYAVATPEPLKQKKSSLGPDFILSETIDMNLKQGLDDYESNWQDTIHAHGLLTAGGEPVNGDELREDGYNDQMEIWWDEEWVGNASIQADGTYELDIFLNPNDGKFNPGTHEVWSWYKGEWHSLGGDEGFWILAPARSADNSTVTVYGIAEITLTVNPTITSRGGDLLYDGSAHFLNGTPLSGEDIGLFLGGTKFIDISADSSGDFSYTHTVPSQFPLGTTIAKANWTTTASYMKGNWSNEIEIDILLLASDITIDSSPKEPDEVHMLQDITIFGYLTDQENESGLQGQEVSIWWGNDTSAINLGNTTVSTPDGYYQLDTQVPTNYEGSVNYWAIFDSPYPSYLGSRSGNLTITVNRLNVEISIQINPQPGHLLETITIDGIVTLPQISDILEDAPLRVWWSNISGTYELGVDSTNTTGGYSLSYQIPLSEAFGGVSIWANYTPHENAYYSNESQHIPILVTNYDTSISLSTNSTYYYLNETIHVYGPLQRDDSVPVPSQLIDFYMTWHNGSVTHLQLLTNSTGYYNYYYTLTVADGVGTIFFDANFTSPTRLYENSTLSTPESVNLVLYTFTLSGSLNSSTYHLDEVLQFSGTLTFNEGGVPASGKTIAIWYQNDTGIFSFSKVTDGAGDFTFLYNFSINDALGAIWVWANFTGINPLFDNATSPTNPATVIQYDLDVSFTTDKVAYYLDEIIHVTGRLTFVHNGTPIAGEIIRIYWDNGSQYEFQNTTDVGGYFYLDYSLNPYTDSVGTVIIESNFTHFYKPWENDTWTAPGITLNRYSLSLTCFTNGTSFYLDQIVNVTGHLEFAHNGTELEGEYVIINWLNSSLNQFVKQTDSSGNFQFFYNLSTDTDSAGPADVWLQFMNLKPLWNNATSNARNLTLNRYSFTLTCFTNGTSFYLDQIVNITGTLEFSHNSTPLDGLQIAIIWDNGTTHAFFKTTDSQGKFEFYYNLTGTKDSEGFVDVWLNFTNFVPLWNNATSNTQNLALSRYSFTFTCLTNGTSFYLNQVVNVTGVLEYSHNSTPLAGRQIKVLWDNGSIYQFYKTTDGSGSFQFFYNLTGDTDSPGSVDVYLNFNNSNPLWNNATSSTTQLTLSRYSFLLSCTTNGTSFYLDQVVNITGQLVYQHNSTPLVGAQITINWDNGSVHQFFATTDSSGYYQLLYNLSGAKDSAGLIDINATFSTINPLWNSASSSTVTINLTRYQFTLTCITNGTSFFLDQVVNITGQLTFTHNATGLAGQAILIIWNNGSEYYDLAITGINGYFQYLYYLSASSDSPGFVSIQANFTHFYPLWENKTSSIQNINLLQYQLQLDVLVPSTIYLDQSIVIQGNLTHSAGLSPVPGLSVNVWYNDSSVWTLLGTPVTNSTGGFKYLFNFTVPPDEPGSYQFKCNTSTGPLYIDTTTGILTVIAQKHYLGIGVALAPNPAYLNESFTIYVQLLFAYNSSAVPNVNVSIYWDWGNGTVFFIDNATTDLTGLATYFYSGMSNYIVWTGISIFANFSETAFINSAESLPESLTLQQWTSEITGFDTGGTTFSPLETVTISGSLFYTNLSGPDVPFVSTDVIIYANGTPIATVPTLSDGSFSYDWLIPSTVVLGVYNIETCYISGVNWIADYNSSSIQIILMNYNLVWEFQVTPNPAHRSEYLFIRFNLTLDNGSAYAGALINIYWEHIDAGGLPEILDSVTTDANGRFTGSILIEVTIPLGTTNVWASCTPAHTYVNPGISNIESIQIELIPVNIDANVDTSLAYLSDDLIFSGTLTFGNLTPMDGYYVRIIWTAASQPYSWNVSLITDFSGSFVYTYNLPWGHPVGISNFYVEFVKASDAFGDNQTSIQSVEIWDLVDIILENQYVTAVGRGDSIDVRGYVVNMGSVNIGDVLVRLLIDGNETGLEDATDNNGQFSINRIVPSNANPDFYIFTMNISSNYYELNQSDSWNITVKLESYLQVIRVNPLDRRSFWADIMPGETFSFDIRLQDEVGLYLNDTYVNVYLNDTFLLTSYLAIPDYNLVQITIPLTWATSGYYYLNITYSGDTFILPTWGPKNDNDDLHIFKEVYVDITGDTVVASMTRILISGILIDDLDNPVFNREVSMIYNGTPFHNVTTAEDGTFSYSDINPTNITGDYEYTIIFYSITGNRELGPFTLTVRAQGGFAVDTMVLILWIVIIAAEITIAMILITRKRFSYSRRLRLFHPEMKVGAKSNQQLILRWL